MYLWLAVTTGARRGELVALRWSSCDLERGELLVDANYVVRQVSAGSRARRPTTRAGCPSTR